MKKFWMFLLLATAALVQIGAASAAPETKSSGDPGLQACYNWCAGHNSYDKSRTACYNGCDTYYRCTVAKRNPECDTARVPMLSTQAPSGPPTISAPIGTKPGRLKPPKLLLPTVGKSNGVIVLKHTN
jgi:hypothetical protein